MPDDELPSPPPTPPSAWVPPPPEQPEATPAAPPTGADLALALVGGSSARSSAASCWGYLVKTTKTELGIVAIGVGVLAGFGVTLLARGKRGRAFQVIAALAALVGILWGKYFGFVTRRPRRPGERVRSPGDTLPLFSGDDLLPVQRRVLDLFSGFDVAWIVFAVYTAWRIPGRSRLRPDGAGNPARVTALPEVPRPI